MSAEEIRCDGVRPGWKCKSYPSWTIKAADKRMHTCGAHMNQVCKQMLATGVLYMTISETEREFH